MDEQIILSFVAFLLISLVIPLVFALTSKLGPNLKNCYKDEAYESGVKTEQTIGTATQKFSIKYYLIAIIFVVFDIEVVFMYPWAVNLKELGFVGLIEMFVFMGILLLGLVYVYGKKVLKWA